MPDGYGRQELVKLPSLEVLNLAPKPFNILATMAVVPLVTGTVKPVYNSDRRNR